MSSQAGLAVRWRRACRAWSGTSQLCALLLVGSLVSGSAAAQAHNFVCPLRISPAEAQLPEGVAQGFAIAFQPNALAYLVGVAVYDGPPEEGVEFPVAGSVSLPQWNLEGNKRGAVAVCRYEGGIRLGRALGRSVKLCAASVKRSESKGSDGIAIDRATFACQ